MVNGGGQLGLRRAVVGGWRTFWFKPQPAYTLGLVRMSFGALAVVWTLALLPYRYELFSRHGVMSPRPSRAFRVSLLYLCTSDHELLLVWAVLLLSAIAMTVGWHTRMASVLVFVLVHSFVQGYREAFNAGDALISVEALVLALPSSGAALSLDQRRRVGSFWSAQCRAPWATRLLQVQLSVMYLVSVLYKLNGETWINGTAVSYTWRHESQFALLPAPHWLYNSPLLVNVATWNALVVETALATLIWYRWWRPWVLLAGVGLHLGIMVTMNVGFFTPAMFVLYLAFVPPNTVQRLPEVLKQLPARLRTSWQRAVGAITGTEARGREGLNGHGPQTSPDDEASNPTPTRPLDVST
ncbi:MAG: HTTM domain-containing protein [Mycobacterium sp.]